LILNWGREGDPWNKEKELATTEEESGPWEGGRSSRSSRSRRKFFFLWLHLDFFNNLVETP